MSQTTLTRTLLGLVFVLSAACGHVPCERAGGDTGVDALQALYAQGHGPVVVAGGSTWRCACRPGRRTSAPAPRAAPDATPAVDDKRYHFAFRERRRYGHVFGPREAPEATASPGASTAAASPEDDQRRYHFAFRERRRFGHVVGPREVVESNGATASAPVGTATGRAAPSPPTCWARPQCTGFYLTETHGVFDGSGLREVAPHVCVPAR